MTFKSSYIHYTSTGAFSKIVEDYINDEPGLQGFYQHTPDINGIKNAIKERKGLHYDRKLLVEELTKQYSGIEKNVLIDENIKSLGDENTFTICTAHQPNIFTGHLYFIYKILHAIKLADELNVEIKDCHFVPVFYMGSEDADLEELGEVTIDGKKYEWKTAQKDAVGRMKVDKHLIAIIDEIAGRLLVEKYGNEIISLVRNCYSPGKTIEQASFEFINTLFKDRGLLVLLPDNSRLKRAFEEITKKELAEKFSHKAVSETIALIPEKYKVQVEGREINLFYLKVDSRERIESDQDGFSIVNSNSRFSSTEIIKELEQHPERFSPNVILRPVFQELILPNIVFIGGGGELAYWLELKKVFETVSVPFPVLILRNSFMLVNKKTAEQVCRLGFSNLDFFGPEKDLVNDYVKRASMVRLELAEEKEILDAVYAKMSTASANIDITLATHVNALKLQALKKVELLEKKMMNAEKKKFEASRRQISKVKSKLFPGGTLQERVDNLLPYYAILGKEFLDILYNHSTGLKQQFCILEEI